MQKNAYNRINRVARSLCVGIGDQAESCTQLFYFKGNLNYGFENSNDF